MQKHIKSFARRMGRGVNEINNYPQVMDVAQIVQIANSTPKDIIIEIGFGNGERLLAEAKLCPNILFIGCEPYLRGVNYLLQNMQTLNNIVVFTNDCRLLIEYLPSNCKKIYILFADPWPKTKHHKRRILNSDFLELCYSKLKIEGQIIIATDHIQYASWIKNHVISILDKYHDLMSVYPNIISNDMPCDWIKTKYQEKAGNAKIHYFLLQKR